MPALIFVAVALHAQALGMGFYADDYLHQLALEGRLGVASMRPWNLYDFGRLSDWVDLDNAQGTVPWWTPADCEVRFFRPLTSATLWLDHAIHGASAVGYHLTNLLIYAALLVAVQRLYRALGFSAGAALLALAFYAASNGSALPVAWVANRNSLLSTLFTVVALLAVARSVRPTSIALGLALAVCAMLSKESGVIALPLMALRLATSAKDGNGQAAARFGAGVCLALALAFVLGLAFAGYGTHSLFYATPWREPLRYLGNLGVLFTAGSFRLIAPASLDLWLLFPALLLPVVVLSTVLVSLLGAIMYRSLRAAPQSGLLLAWLVVGFLPQGGTLPSDRSLLDAAIGSAGLLALFVSSTLSGSRAASDRERFAARSVFCSAVLLGGLFTIVQSSAIARMSRDVRARVLSTEVGDPVLGRRELIVMQASSALIPFTIGSTWSAECEDDALRFWVMQVGRRGFIWSREDERTLVIESTDEPFLTHVFEKVYRTSPEPPPPGTRFSTALFEIAVLTTSAGGVSSFRVRFERSVDDPTILFLIDREGDLVPTAPPAIGDSAKVPTALPTAPMQL